MLDEGEGLEATFSFSNGTAVTVSGFTNLDKRGVHRIPRLA
jgi:hypothetical protein